MQMLGVVILVALIILAVFSLANWAVLTAPTTLSFVAFDIEAALGVILLGVTLVMVLLFVFYALALRTNMLMESHRHNQALQVQRKLAESAETSRFNDLHTQIGQEFFQLRCSLGEIESRMSKQEESIKLALGESANSLAALVGEMDDRIDRALVRNPN